MPTAVYSRRHLINQYQISVILLTHSANSSGISFSSLPRALTDFKFPFLSTINSDGIELIPHDVENSLAQPLP